MRRLDRLDDQARTIQMQFHGIGEAAFTQSHRPSRRVAEWLGVFLANGHEGDGQTLKMNDFAVAFTLAAGPGRRNLDQVIDEFHHIGQFIDVDVGQEEYIFQNFLEFKDVEVSEIDIGHLFFSPGPAYSCYTPNITVVGRANDVWVSRRLVCDVCRRRP
jgi:hypothetical protein